MGYFRSVRGYVSEEMEKVEPIRVKRPGSVGDEVQWRRSRVENGWGGMDGGIDRFRQKERK